MNYTEAVRLARIGDERGFGYLYESTYRSKYYLALQYMKNREAAEDVLQDAYLKAFSKLDMLEQPEHFSAWLGQIVANTAKNALAKNNPLLFTDVAAETEIEDFVDRVEDDDVTGQPELSYTREETRELVRELIDALSDEQRMCILMFHIEGISIKEIAQTLDCSENTVKSRLNYGRKNLKIKAEELQKKGYKLYSIAPLPLLLFLLRTDRDTMLAEGSIQIVGRCIADYIFARIPSLHPVPGVSQGTSGTSQMASGTSQAASEAVQAGTGAGKAAAAKAGFLHAVAGKAVVAVLSVCIAGGTIYGVTQTMGHDTGTETGQTQQEQMQQTETEVETEAEPQSIPVTDTDYPDLIEGSLTKEELEFVFAYGPETLTEQGLSEGDYLMFLNCWCQASEPAGQFITFMGQDANYRHGYAVEDINRYLSSFTEYRFTEDNDSDTPYGNDVNGDTIWIMPAELSFEAKASIVDASYIEDTMTVHFSYEKNSYENGLTMTDKTATLKKNANDKFQIIAIVEGFVPAEGTAGSAQMDNTESQAAVKNDGSTASVRTIYEGVLTSVQNNEAGYELPNAGGSSDFQYFLWDMNGDGIKELIVGALFTEDVFDAYDIPVFTVVQDLSGYTLKAIDGDMVSLAIYLPADGNGLYTMDMSRGTGEIRIYRLTIAGDTLTMGSAPELTYTLGDDPGAQFINSNSCVGWMSAYGMDGLAELE